MNVEDSLTICCQAPWKVVSRANYACTKCGKDVTMHIILLAQAEQEQQQNINSKENEREAKSKSKNS